jgi:hypothetical protein
MSSGDSSKNTSGDELPVVSPSSPSTSSASQVIAVAAPVSPESSSIAGSPGGLLLPSSPSVPSPDHASSSGSAHDVLVAPTDRSSRSWTWTDSDMSSSGSFDYPGTPSDDDSSSVSTRSRPPSAVSSHGSFNAEEYVDVPEEQDPERDADDEADEDTEDESDEGSDGEPPAKKARGDV